MNKKKKTHIVYDEKLQDIIRQQEQEKASFERLLQALNKEKKGKKDIMDDEHNESNSLSN